MPQKNCIIVLEELITKIISPVSSIKRRGWDGRLQDAEEATNLFSFASDSNKSDSGFRASAQKSFYFLM